MIQTSVEPKLEEKKGTQESSTYFERGENRGAHLNPSRACCCSSKRGKGSVFLKSDRMRVLWLV